MDGFDAKLGVSGSKLQLQQIATSRDNNPLHTSCDLCAGFDPFTKLVLLHNVANTLSETMSNELACLYISAKK